MMTTTKRNTSVAQHTAMIITRPGHQVSSVGQKVDLGAVKREWKNTLIVPNQQGIIRYASATHAVALHQDHRYMQRCYFTFRTHFFLFSKQSISLIGTEYFLSQSPDDQVLCVRHMVLSTKEKGSALLPMGNISFLCICHLQLHQI